MKDISQCEGEHFGVEKCYTIILKSYMIHTF